MIPDFVAVRPCYYTARAPSHGPNRGMISRHKCRSTGVTLASRPPPHRYIRYHTYRQVIYHRDTIRRKVTTNMGKPNLPARVEDTLPGGPPAYDHSSNGVTLLTYPLCSAEKFIPCPAPCTSTTEARSACSHNAGGAFFTFPRNSPQYMHAEARYPRGDPRLHSPCHSRSKRAHLTCSQENHIINLSSRSCVCIISETLWVIFLSR